MPIIHKVLFVDDEVNILNSLKRLMRKEGYEIYTAESGKEGIVVLSREHISLVVSDQKMPEMDGATFLSQAKEISPDTVRIMLTGYADIKSAMEAINKGEIFRFITKPWDDLELKTNIKQGLSHYELVSNNKRLTELTKLQNIELTELNTNLEKKVQERTVEILQKNSELNILYKELETNFFDSIRVFSGIIELYNPFLGIHSKRVALISSMIAKMLKLEDREIVVVEIAAMLHDIGMIGIPKDMADVIHESLEGDRRKVYESHTITAQDIIKNIKKLDGVGSVIRAHHERFDGKGYPDGLKKGDIPFHARIISVADYYDHLRSSLMKNDPLIDRGVIINNIKGNIGIMFDPEVVKKFLEIIPNIRERNPMDKERLVSVNDLKKGMVLSREIYTDQRFFLAAKGAILNDLSINRIKNYSAIGAIDDEVYIYDS